MAVIFDMDGVLADTEPLYVQVTSQVLGRNGATEDPVALYRYVGISAFDMWSELKEKHSLDRPVEELAREESAAQHEAIDGAGALRPMLGVPDLLALLRDNGVTVALASSSSRSLIHAVLRSIELSDQFGIIVSGEDVDHGKPSPDIFLRAADLLKCPPSTCVVIEDSPHGLAGANAAGMISVGFHNTGSGDQCLKQADFTISNFGPRERACILEVALLAQQGARAEALARATQLRRLPETQYEDTRPPMV